MNKNGCRRSPLAKTGHHVRRLRLAAWLVFAGSVVYLYYSHAGFFESELREVTLRSAATGYLVYLLVSSIRGLTLIPAATFLFLAIPLFPPAPLFVLTLLGILISSTSIYYFSESLRLDEYFEERYPSAVAKARSVLRKNPTTIVAAWSFFPFAPTDVICYVCGVMRISFGRFILGVMIGEGAIGALYVFVGANVSRLWRGWG
jgi:uncharacterized membrane protein YdjX (TVP38/TMEM64 family)